MLKLAVAGEPIIHSRSPELFGSSGLDLSYDKIETNHSQNLIKFLTQNKYNGCNLTSPLKESIIPFLDSLDDISREIGAVNTIKISHDKCEGFNTDPYGVIESLKLFNVSGLRALVIGSGGASKSAIYALKKLGSKVIVCGRNNQAVNNLVNIFHIDLLDWNKLSIQIKNFDIIVSTVPSILDLSFELTISNNQIFLDANYKDPHISKYPNRINGLTWLKTQAEKSLEIFSGKSCELEFKKKDDSLISNLIVLN